ncbi:hypothetical protein [Corynebacterium sanguinis]|uniref:hypothetical protein n=1 Tax=Corynebacterium sanguinis TaxID=2594913 RepID=UPI00223BE97A|nr:hypothetical protein [Corynebacterium sanguinis]MCT1597748.1 hypothetical protein [Corynebacterium sanguinis]
MRSGSNYSVTGCGGTEIATARHGFFRPKMNATISGAPCSIEFSNSPLTARLTRGTQPAATLQRQWDGMFQEFGRPHRYTPSIKRHTGERPRAAILGIAVAVDMMVLAAQQAGSTKKRSALMAKGAFFSADAVGRDNRI